MRATSSNAPRARKSFSQSLNPSGSGTGVCPCAGTGRATIRGISRHCDCRIGRALARGHWAVKATEEAA